MMKALAWTGDDRLLVILGLAPENLARLAAGEPIQVDTSRPTPEGFGLPAGPIIGVMAVESPGHFAAMFQNAGVAANPWPGHDPAPPAEEPAPRVDLETVRTILAYHLADVVTGIGAVAERAERITDHLAAAGLVGWRSPAPPTEESPHD